MVGQERKIRIREIRDGRLGEGKENYNGNQVQKAGEKERKKKSEMRDGRLGEGKYKNIRKTRDDRPRE